MLGRLEATFGDGGEGVLVKAVYLPQPRVDDPEIRRLARRGPQVTYGPNLVEVEGLLVGGWPVVVEYRLEEPGSLQLTVEIDGDSRSERYDLPGRPGSLGSEIVRLPSDLGNRPKAGLLRMQALNATGEAVPFEFLGVGAGKGAIASLAVAPVVFRPSMVGLGSGGQPPSYCFVSTRFNTFDVEVFHRRVEEQGKRKVLLQESVAVLDDDEDYECRRVCRDADSSVCRAASVRSLIRCCEGLWSWIEAPPRPGSHTLQVRAWDGPLQAGNWVVAVSADRVVVVP